MKFLLAILLVPFVLSAATVPAVSPYGLVLMPSMGVRLNNSNTFLVQVKGRVSSPHENDILKHVIDETKLVHTPDIEGKNYDLRTAYFHTHSSPKVQINVNFEGGVEISPAVMETGKDGLFSKFTSVAVDKVSADRRLWWEVNNVPVRSFAILAEDEGFSIVTDIDDTIRLSGVAWLPALAKKSFFSTFNATETMPEFFASMNSALTWTTSTGRISPPTFHYLSGSPLQFLPTLQPWLERVYPLGESVLPPLAWSDGGILGLTRYQEFKIEKSTEILTFFPKRKLILMGDSTQFDAEAYAKVEQQYPDNIWCIFIRISSGFNTINEISKNANSRFERAFKDVPREKWSTFKTSADLPTAEEIAGGRCRKL